MGKNKRENDRDIQQIDTGVLRMSLGTDARPSSPTKKRRLANLDAPSTTNTNFNTKENDPFIGKTAFMGTRQRSSITRLNLRSHVSDGYDRVRRQGSKLKRRLLPGKGQQKKSNELNNPFKDKDEDDEDMVKDKEDDDCFKPCEATAKVAQEPFLKGKHKSTAFSFTDLLFAGHNLFSSKQANIPETKPSSDRDEVVRKEAEVLKDVPILSSNRRASTIRLVDDKDLELPLLQTEGGMECASTNSDSTIRNSSQKNHHATVEDCDEEPSVFEFINGVSPETVQLKSGSSSNGEVKVTKKACRLEDSSGLSVVPVKEPSGKDVVIVITSPESPEKPGHDTVIPTGTDTLDTEMEDLKPDTKLNSYSDSVVPFQSRDHQFGQIWQRAVQFLLENNALNDRDMLCGVFPEMLGSYTEEEIIAELYDILGPDCNRNLIIESFRKRENIDTGMMKQLLYEAAIHKDPKKVEIAVHLVGVTIEQWEDKRHNEILQRLLESIDETAKQFVQESTFACRNRNLANLLCSDGMKCAVFLVSSPIGRKVSDVIHILDIIVSAALSPYHDVKRSVYSQNHDDLKAQDALASQIATLADAYAVELINSIITTEQWELLRALRKAWISHISDAKTDYIAEALGTESFWKYEHYFTGFFDALVGSERKDTENFKCRVEGHAMALMGEHGLLGSFCV